MENLNYPIKYALLPIDEQVGWITGIHQLEREYKTVGYVVSKVYLVSKMTKYYGNGKSKDVFEVVFPYNNIDDIKNR